MVIIFSKTLEKKKGVNDVTSKSIERQLSELRTMNRGSAIFSRGTVEADGWLELGLNYGIQQKSSCQIESSLESLWDTMPESGSQHWTKEPGTTTAITSLIRDLSLSNNKINEKVTSAPNQTPSAPPSKRQCRSLSFSDEFGGFRSSWKPQGSRVWTAVEKRRCHSGGSVRAGGRPFPPMQRSSSFSLPSYSSVSSEGALDLPFFNRLPLHPEFTASSVSPTSPSSHSHPHSHSQVFLRPLSLSHEQISLTELQSEEASETSSPDSTPELGRRAGKEGEGKASLSRSKSQPCVLNDKKIAMKRRRPEDAQEQRPFLDLTKMTQKLHTFQSLSCPGFSDSCQSNLPPPFFEIAGQSESDFRAVPELENQNVIDDEEEDSSYEELDSDSACSVNSRPDSPARIADSKRTLWKGDCGTHRDIFQLGGELDIDQIEKN